MCGIVFLAGPNAKARLPECLARLAHRGPDDRRTWTAEGLALGFNRLAINGGEFDGRQPVEYGEWVAAINGEIYNHHALADAHGLELSHCDTRVVLPLLAKLGPRVIDELDGFYAAIAIRSSAREVLTLRDPMGKKPLFLGRSGSEWVITSELKALDTWDSVVLLPRGAARVDLQSGQVTHLAERRLNPSPPDIRTAFTNAVAKRLPPNDQPVAIFLSGGLDSSLVAAEARQVRDDIVHFTLGDDGPDRDAATTVAAHLGLSHLRRVPLPKAAELPELLRDVVRATESYNPSIVSNGLATYLLAQAAHREGIKVVLTGEGADEMFGGYHQFERGDPWRETRDRLVDDMHFTELRRLDLSCMAHSVEARCPFLDEDVRAISSQLPFEHLYDGGMNKVVLRRAFEGHLPPEILGRKKTSFDVGSGLRGQVVRYLRRDGENERTALRAIWQECFDFDPTPPYFHAYPVFNDAIDRRGEQHR